MKIRYFINLGDPAQGGLEKLSVRLAQQMIKSGHELRIVARFFKPYGPNDLVRMDQPRVFTVEGVEVEIISVKGWRLRLLQPVPGLRRHRKTFPVARALYDTAFRSEIDRAIDGADLVHYFGLGWEMLGFAAQAGAQRKHIPFVVEPALHANQRGDGPSDWLLYQKADLVIAHTEFEAEILRQGSLRASHIHVVRHGFDALDPGDGVRFRKLHGIKGPMILFVGRRCHEKGYYTLLEAFAVLARQVPGLSLVILGPGDAPPSTAEGVIELGRVSDQIKQDALSACTLFCMPSRGESFGMAYFEAWSCGKPVVALDLPVLRETIGKSGGGLLAVDNPGDVAAKVRHLLDHPGLSDEMGAQGKEFSRHYRWSDTAQSCLEAYRQARQNHTGRSAAVKRSA